MTHIINQHGVGVKCPDDEINEQRSLTTPAITLSDHRTVYDAKCGRPQWGRGVVKCGQGGYKNGSFFADVLYGRPLIKTPTSLHEKTV